MSHLAADRAAADDAKTLGQFCQRKQIFIGQVVDRLHAFDWWSSRAGSRGDDCFLEFKLSHFARRRRNRNRVVILEAALSEEDVDAEVSKTLSRIGRADVGALLPHPCHCFVKVYRCSFRNVNAEGCCVAHGGGDSCRADDAFGWHAPDVQAIAAHQLTLDQSDARSESSCSGGGDQARCSGSDNDKVILRFWIRV